MKLSLQSCCTFSDDRVDDACLDMLTSSLLARPHIHRSAWNGDSRKFGRYPPAPMLCFYRLRRILILLLCIMMLSVLFLLVGCGGSGSQGQGGQQEPTTHHQSANVVLNLHPEGNSGVNGTASFEDTSDGVLVKRLFAVGRGGLLIQACAPLACLPVAV